MSREKSSLTLVLIFIGLLACLATVTSNYRGQASAKVVWEYKLVSNGSGELPERFMNALGAEGWELVQIVSGDEIESYKGSFLFKRAK